MVKRKLSQAAVLLPQFWVSDRQYFGAGTGPISKSAKSQRFSASLQYKSAGQVQRQYPISLKRRAGLGLPMARRVGFFLGGSPDPVLPSSSF